MPGAGASGTITFGMPITSGRDTTAWALALRAANFDIAVRDFASTSNATAMTSVPLTMPAGAVQGDFLVAVLGTKGLEPTSSPTGWTAIAPPVTVSGQITVAGYYKRAGASEPSSYSWPLGGSETSGGGITAYRNVSTSNPFDVATPSTASISFGGGGTTVTLPSITTVTNGTLLMAGIAINTTTTTASITPPASMTEQFEVSGRRTSYSHEAWNVAGATGVSTTPAPPAAGATGTRTFTWNSTQAGAGFLTALRPGT